MVAWLLWSISHGRFPSPRILINPYIKDSPFHRVNGLHNLPTIRVGNGAGPIMGIHAGPCKGDSNLPDRLETLNSSFSFNVKDSPLIYQVCQASSNLDPQ
ncbi:hypothetical protein SAY86_006808 [Trapa natans]|uniref:Uncharacterized protein n=1 Tax=Trapa natans TaxID=22666 RepID=A0AAN7L6H1_TRANT|nr:hypothetical protein SAY86_006808 [Trapa natans]